MMKTLFTLPAFLLLFSMADISTNEEGHTQQSTGTETLADSTEWKLVALRDADQLDTIGSTRAFIRFDAGNGRVGGNGGCNSFGGSLAVADNSIHIDRIFSTKMYCADVQRHEDQFFRLLEQADRWQLDESQLKLSKGDTVLLVFQKK